MNGALEHAAFSSGAHRRPTERIYRGIRNGQKWVSCARLRKSSPHGGVDIEKRQMGTRSPVGGVGWSTDGDGLRAALEDSGTIREAYLKASNTDARDNFGYSLALVSDTLAVGAVGESGAATGVGGDQSDDSASDAGAVHVFENVEL